jgi:hypothetical protein
VRERERERESREQREYKLKLIKVELRKATHEERSSASFAMLAFHCFQGVYRRA